MLLEPPGFPEQVYTFSQQKLMQRRIKKDKGIKSEIG
jgi:hypothetical protein